MVSSKENNIASYPSGKGGDRTITLSPSSKLQPHKNVRKSEGVVLEQFLRLLAEAKISLSLLNNDITLYIHVPVLTSENIIHSLVCRSKEKFRIKYIPIIRRQSNNQETHKSCLLY